MDRKSQIDAFYRLNQVSRETIDSLKLYEKTLIESNEKLNLIGKSTIKDIWSRHFLDSYQVVDLIEENDNIMDLGSGAGFPGIVIGVAALERKIGLKINLLEKSKKKSIFLKKIVKQLNLDKNIKIINEDIMDKNYRVLDEVFLARAFKPLTKIFELIHNKVKNFKKILIFQGKTGSQELLQASKSWDIEYKQRQSITSNDSIILEIKGLKKKIDK